MISIFNFVIWIREAFFFILKCIPFCSKTKPPLGQNPPRTTSPGQNPPQDKIPPDKIPLDKVPRTKSPHYILYTISPCHPNSKHFSKWVSAKVGITYGRLMHYFRCVCAHSPCVWLGRSEHEFWLCMFWLSFSDYTHNKLFHCSILCTLYKCYFRRPVFFHLCWTWYISWWWSGEA